MIVSKHKRAQSYYLDFSDIEKVQADVETVFRDRIKCTKEEHEILLLKAYGNVSKGCRIVEISKSVPREEVDTYKQYDHKCKVVFKTPSGDEGSFYMSHHNSGKEATTYWKLKFLKAENELEKIKGERA